MAINTQKFLPGTSKVSASSIVLTSEDKKNINTIRVKTIQVDKILKGTLAADKKRLTDKKKEASRQRKEDIETKLEKKPTKDKAGFKMPQILPKMGFLDWIKNFIGNILLGFFAVRLVEHLPKLKWVLKGVMAVGEFIINFGGKILNGLTTFIDLGYKAYDWTRGAIKNLGGDGLLKQFDRFTGVIGTLIDVLVVASIVNASRNDDGGGGWWGKGKKNPRSWKNRGGGGRSRVSTSGGKTVPRPGRFSKLPKIPGLGWVGKALGPLFFMWDLASRKGSGQTNVQAGVGAGSSWAGFTAGSTLAGKVLAPLLVAPFPGARPLYALGVLGAGILGATGLSAVADTATGANKVEGMNKGGKVKKASRKFTPRAALTKKKRDIKKPVITPILLPSKSETEIEGEKKWWGENAPVVGDLIKKAKGLWGTVNKWKDNIIGLFLDPLKVFGDKFIDVKFFGPILTIAVKSLMGQKLSQKDYDAVGVGLSSLINFGLNKGTLLGNIMSAFAKGGIVDPQIRKKEENVPKWISQEFRKSMESMKDDGGFWKKIQKELGIEQEDDEDEPGAGPGAGPGGNITGESGSVSGNDQQKARKMYNYLMRKPGMTHNKAAGIVANIKFESGFRTSVMGDNGTSGGLFQMHAGRLTRMENAVPNWRNNWKGQIDYALTDDRGPEYMNMTFNSAGDAANWWMRNWERPAEELRDEREHNQRQWIKKINWQGKIDSDKGTSKGPGLFPLDPSQMPGQTYSSGTGGSMVPSEKGTRTSGELGKFLKQSGVGSWGSGVWQHPWFGGSPRRSYPSWHNVDRALDIGGNWPEDQRQILPKIAEFNAKHGVKPVELLYGKPGTPESGTHKDHVHVAYHKGGEVPGKGERWARLLGGEMVIDIDSAGPAKDLLLAINQASDRRGVMKAISDYAPYEAIQSRMIPVEKMVPVPMPIPMGSSDGGVTVIGGGGGEDSFSSLVAIG